MKGIKLLALGLLGAPIVAAEAQVDLDHPVKQFSFEQTSFRSCVMQSGSLTFDAGGNGQVSLATMTTSNRGETWKSRVVLRDGAGSTVYTSPMLNSPRMENSDHHPQTYNWSFNFRIEPQLLQSVTTAQMIDISC